MVVFDPSAVVSSPVADALAPRTTHWSDNRNLATGALAQRRARRIAARRTVAAQEMKRRQEGATA
jgi:hypothetical protein